MISNPTENIEFTKALYQEHERYREPTLENRRIKHADITPLLEELSNVAGFKVEQLGASVEGRAIRSVRLGSGKKRILLWSQMHGDEPTATMALFDIFRFFQAGDEFDWRRRRILDNTTLFFIPMLNPDGAERYQRRNALDIDLNRDARNLSMPEARILKSLRDEIDADFGFNLHDQERYYTAGRSKLPATISFLAPAAGADKAIGPGRERSMRLIVGLNQILQGFIPGNVGRYSDDFYPQAFGDNIQKWGTSTILVESGWAKGDSEKQYVRRLNFVLLLGALEAIATGSYEQEDIAAYPAIPENKKRLFDLVLRNATVERNGQRYVMDLGINRYEEAEGDGFCFRSRIVELGDLSDFVGYDELDAEGLLAEPVELNGGADFMLRKDGGVLYTIANGRVLPA